MKARTVCQCVSFLFALLIASDAFAQPCPSHGDKQELLQFLTEHKANGTEVDWSLCNLWVDVPIWQLLMDKHEF